MHIVNDTRRYTIIQTLLLKVITPLVFNPRYESLKSEIQDVEELIKSFGLKLAKTKAKHKIPEYQHHHHTCGRGLLPLIGSIFERIRFCLISYLNFKLKYLCIKSSVLMD